MSNKSRNLREAFLAELCALVEEGRNIVALDCEVGTATYTWQFGQKYPSRYYEMGVAEQNMFGTAAGLATCGVIPFATTFATFTSMRACEMIRTSICYPRLNVKMIGGYAGLSNGKDGATHHSLEDLAIMRAIANNVVLVCSDPVMTGKIVRGAVEYDGPVYIRMEYEQVPDVHAPGTEFAIGKAFPCRAGKDVTVATCGTALIRALEAAEQLAKEGIDAEVIDVVCLKPLDERTLTRSLAKTGAIVTVEDHGSIGGLGSAVAELLARQGIAAACQSLAIQDLFTESGKTDELRSRYGIDRASIVRAAVALVEKKRRKG